MVRNSFKASDSETDEQFAILMMEFLFSVVFKKLQSENKEFDKLIFQYAACEASLWFEYFI